MKKIGIKTKLSIILCLTAVIIFSSLKIYGELQPPEDSETVSTQEINLESADASIRSALTTIAKKSDKDASTRELVRFMEWVEVYNPDEDAKAKVTQLIKEGADIDALIEVCIFWEDTNEPFSIVEEIYNHAPVEDFDEIDDHVLWIEPTFNALTGREEQALTIDEVKAYVEAGISTSDIRIANRMSRKDADIKTVLEERKSGKSWYELIMADSSVAPPENPEVLGGNNLLDAKIIAEKTNMPIETVLAETEEKEDGEFLYAIRQEKSEIVTKELVQMGLISDVVV